MNAAVTTVDNVVDSLRRVVRDLDEDDARATRAVKGALAWGWHSVGLLAYRRLQPLRDRLDDRLREYLHPGEPDLDVERDAWWAERERLSHLELLDLLSEEELPLLEPEFFRGWVDPEVRCRRVRREMATLLGRGVDEEWRQRLLVLLAAYHRLIRLPAEVRLDPDAVLDAFPALLDLVTLLVDPEWDGVDEIGALVSRSRRSLAGRASSRTR